LSSKKVFIENDANCAVWAEYKSGAGKGFDTVLIATIGTGIGGGLVSKGKLFRGATGNALEVGSMKIFADKRQKCTCGRYDCWESYASGTGLKKCAEVGAGTYAEFKDSFLNSKQVDEITTYDIIEGVQKQDAFSKKVFEQWVDYMILGLVNLTNIFNPDCIVISGGMCEFLDFQDMENRINEEIVVSKTKVKIATTKNNAGMIGAGLLAINSLYS
jgi:glucokinase